MADEAPAAAARSSRVTTTQGTTHEVQHGITSVKKWLFGADKDDGSFEPAKGVRELTLVNSTKRVIVNPAHVVSIEEL